MIALVVSTEHDASLVGVSREEGDARPRRVRHGREGASLAGGRTPRFLDQEHLRAQLSEDLAGVLSRDVANLDDA